MAATPFDLLSNGASTVLRLPHVAGDGVLNVQNTAGFVAPTRVTLYTGVGPLSERRYCILAVTAVNHTTKQLTVSGAVEGTTDVNLKAGVRVEIRGTAEQYNTLTTAVRALQVDFDNAGLSGSSTYTHAQNTPADTWTIDHNLARYPAVTVVDSAGSVVIGAVRYSNENQIVISFSGGFAGTAYLN